MSSSTSSSSTSSSPTSSSSLVHPYSPLLQQQQQQPSNNTNNNNNNNNNNKKLKKTNSPTGPTATIMITSQAGSPSLVVPLLQGETTNRPPAKPASLSVSSSVFASFSSLKPADHPLPASLLSPADHQYPHLFFVTSLSSPFSPSSSTSSSSCFPPPPSIHQQSPSPSSFTLHHPPPSPPSHPPVFPHHHLHPPPHSLLHQQSNFASSPTSSSPSSRPLSEPNHHRHPSLQHQRTDSPSSLKQQQHHHHRHHPHHHTLSQQQQQQDHKQQQRLLLYKHQRQQQLRMMQQQNNILQQQQHQQQQLLLQRQNQQKLELKQQQKQHLQQLHLQLNPPRVNVATAASEATPTEATRDYQPQQTQAQVQAQEQQQCNPSPSPTSATKSFDYPSLQQRRASLLQQRPAPPTISLSPPSTSNTSQSTFKNNSLSSVRIPLRTPMVTLSPQKYQGLVASGALPVRQALQTHIASSGEKPPQTKEEARTALEVMFQIRADKIRRAIEEGKLATTEALQHRVIRRRESVFEGSQKSSKLHHSSHPKDRSMSAPSERATFSAIAQYHTAVTATATAAHPPQSLMSENVFQQSWLPSPAHGHVHPLHPHPSSTAIISQEPLSIHGHGNTTGYTAPINNDTANVQQGPGAGTTAEDPMVIEAEEQGQHDITFGLSDDDIMSSFTDFTAKLGDSLLVRGVPRFGGMGGTTTVAASADTVPPPPPGYNSFGINANQQDNNCRVAAAAVGGVPQELPLERMMVDTALPTLSPTASSESQSPSPWIPWHGPSTHKWHDSVANSLSGATGPSPMALHPFAQAQTQAQHPIATTILSPSQAQQHAPMSTLVMSQQQQPDQQSYPSLFSKGPRNQGPQNSSAFGVDVHSVQIHPQGGFSLGGQGVQGGGGSYVGEKQVEAWNQYLQYLLHLQEFSDHHFQNQGNNPLIPAEHGQQLQHHVQQDPFVQQQQQTGGAGLSIASSPQPNVVMDPHWQATMMTMMLDQNPTREAIHGLDQQPGFNIASTIGGGIVGNGQRMTSSLTFPPTGAHLAM